MNKKIKIIDLIKKMYNENDYDLPLYIKYQNKIFKLDENLDYIFNDEFSIMSYLKNKDCLEYEVEIIEDTPNKIEKIPFVSYATCDNFEDATTDIRVIITKLNEVIDTINEIGNNKRK